MKNPIRFGAVIPASNLTVEPELHDAVAEEAHLKGRVCLHVSRITYLTKYRSSPTAYVAEIGKNAQFAVDQLAQLPLRAMGYFCTSATAMASLPSGGSPTPVLGAAQALVHACQTVSAERAFLLTPYDLEIGHAVASLLVDEGIEIVGQHHADIRTSATLHQYAHERLCHDIGYAKGSKADSVLVCCTNLPSFHLIDAAEQWLGKRVISSNQALFRALLEFDEHLLPLSSQYGSLMHHPVATGCAMRPETHGKNPHV